MDQTLGIQLKYLWMEPPIRLLTNQAY
jgi:hypothetical protein